MKKSLQMLTLVAAGLTMLTATGCDKLRARDQLNKGVAAYKNAKYEEAINHFQDAVSLDPSLTNARLYLATAFAQQYIPGVDTPENLRNADQAVEQYKAVLEKDNKNVNSVKGIAYLFLQQKKFEDAKTYYRKALEIDPNDPERMEARAKLGLKPEDPLGTKKDKEALKVCAALKEKNMAVVQDGIDNLDKALQLRPDYDDAMAYLNLLYREKADVECSDTAARTADLKTADEWVDKTMATKKAKAEKQTGAQGIVLDQKQ
jgi:tetratricopeptide (TPR) repeat protein